MTTHTAYGAACAAVLAIASLRAGAAQTNDQPTMRFVQLNGIRMRIAEWARGRSCSCAAVIAFLKSLPKP